MKIENINNIGVISEYKKVQNLLKNGIEISMLNVSEQEIYCHLPETYKQRINKEFLKCVTEYGIILRSEIEEL